VLLPILVGLIGGLTGWTAFETLLLKRGDVSDQVDSIVVDDDDGIQACLQCALF
jgi:hypothetical protein